MSQENLAKHFDLGLKVATTIALISVALLGTKFVTKEEFTAANTRIEKIRWDGNTETWPLPEVAYAVRRNELDCSKIQPKPEDVHP